MSLIRRTGRRGIRRGIRGALAAAAAAGFDNLGAELYLRPEGIVASGTDVTAWTNEGTAGAALDLDVAVNTPQKGADYVEFDGTNYLQTTGNPTALNLDDGDSFDMIVIVRGDLTGLRAAMGGAGGAHIRLGTRWGGGSQFVVNDDDATATLVLGQNMSTGQIYVVRGHIEGAETPTDDEVSLRINDFEGAASTEDHSAVTWTNVLRMGNVTGSAFDGRIYGAMAKVGGFSTGELATLTARLNASLGLSLTSV